MGFFEKKSSIQYLEQRIKDLKLIEDCISLQSFNSFRQVLKVTTCYTITAVVISPLLGVMITPMSLILVAAGAYQLVAALVRKNAEERHHRVNTGLALMACGSSLLILNQLIPFILAGMLIYRAFPLLRNKFPAVEEYVTKAWRATA